MRQELEMNIFNNFLRDVELEDVNPLGWRFTWYHSNRRAMSRIGGVFVSNEWVDMWYCGFFVEILRTIDRWCLGG